MKDNSQLLYSIAQMYYIEGLNQDEISKKTGISRPTVSRCLSKAVQTGIVEIKINAPKTSTKISSELEKELNLKKIYIAPGLNLTDYTPEVLKEELSTSKNIGIGWGNTVYLTAQKMSLVKTQTKNGKVILPLVSSLGIKEPHYQVNLMVSLMADSLGGTPYFYNPSDSHIKELKELWWNLDTAVMGLGTGTYGFNGFEPTKDVKGEILGKFFSSKGFIPYSWEGYDGINNEQFLSIKKRICMCEGTAKVDSIIEASKLGLFNILITDKKTADLLYAKVCKGNKK